MVSRKETSSGPRGTESRRPRSCVSCEAKLASDHSGRLCSSCKDGGRGLSDDHQVVDFVLEFHPLRQTLGVLGFDYIFFHRYFGDALQDELAELRLTLYHRREPPRPLGLAEAAAWAARTEKRDTGSEASLPASVSDMISETSLAIGTDRLLLRGFAEPRWPQAVQRNARAVSGRLRELEDELPAATGTLHLALICGTTPLPPGIRASSELREFPQVGFVPAFVLKVFSAKERDIKTAYEGILGGQFNFTKKNYVPLTSQWRTRGPLPVLEITCVPYRGSVPTPAAVQRFFKQARKPVARFFDSAVRTTDYATPSVPGPARPNRET